MVYMNGCVDLVYHYHKFKIILLLRSFPETSSKANTKLTGKWQAATSSEKVKWGVITKQQHHRHCHITSKASLLQCLSFSTSFTRQLNLYIERGSRGKKKRERARKIQDMLSSSLKNGKWPYDLFVQKAH